MRVGADSCPHHDLDIETGGIIYEESGTLGDGEDINCLGNTYGRDVESQGLQ
jgi:hypothetical protein